MSFGGSQGTVRYAVMVDDAQAQRAITTFKSNLTSLQTPSANLSRNMTSLNSTFNAGVKPIQNQGNALNQLSTRQKTIGSQLQGLGSAFKNNALAIGAAASSVLGLYQNYANLSSAQNNANKSATAAKAAQNNLTKAQDNLNKAISKYGSGSKEAKAAQDKLTVAQERAVNKTESAKIAQDNLNQTMADFGINILPNIVLAGGSIVSIFDNIGKEGSKTGSIVSKLADGFGIMGKSADGAKLSVAGLGTAIAAATIVIVTVVKELEVFKRTMDFTEQAKQTNDIATKFDLLHKAVRNISDDPDILHQFLKAISGVSGELDIATKGAAFFVDKAKELALQTQNAVKPSQELSAAIEKMNIAAKDPALKSHVTDTAKAAKAALDHAKAEVERLKALDALNAGLQKILTPAQKLTAEWTLQSKAFEGTVASINLATKAYLDVHNAIVASNPDIQKNIENTRLQKQQTDAIAEALKNETAGLSESAKFTKLFGDKNQIAADTMAFFRQKMDEANASVDSYSAAITAGSVKFSSFVSETELANVTNTKYEAGLRSLVGAYVELNPNIDLTTSQLEDMTKSIIEGKGALLAYADIVAKQMAPAIATFRSLLDAKTIKDFNKAFKELDLGKIDKGLGKGLKEAFKPLRDIAERAGEITHLFDAMAVVGGKLSEKNIGKAIKEIASGFKDMGKTQPLIKEFGNTILSFVKSAPNMADAWKQVNPVMQKFNELTADGSFSLDDYNGVMELFNNTTGKTAGPLKDSGAAMQTFGKSSVAARGEIDQVTGALDTLKAQATNIKPIIEVVNSKALKAIDIIASRIMDLAKLKPTLQVINSKAIKAVDVIAKRIDSLEKIKPQISLQNKSAIKSIDVVAKRINSLEKIKPSISLSNSQAIKVVDVVAKRINSLSNIHATVHVGLSGPGASLASKGDTSIGSKADGGGGGQVISSKSNSVLGIGTGNIIIENHTHVMDQEVIRRVTAQQGKNRYRFG